MDRHADTRRERNGRKREERGGEYQRTCHVYGQTRQYEKGTERGGQQKEASGGRRDSTSAPVTSMDRHTSSKGEHWREK